MSMVICLALAIENLQLKYTGERWLYGILAIYFFYFLHILSIRSGLILGYAGIVILGLFYFRKLVFWKKITLGMIILLTPLTAYKWMPGFEQKINYSVYDFEQFIKGDGQQYSDSERWQSWRAGLEIGNQHPFFGTGTGKFRPALKEYYREVLQKDTYTRPHNQWINVFTCFGLFGLIVFSFVLVYPMTFNLFWNTPLMPTLFIMQLLSMTVEHPLDTAVGTSLFLLFTVMGLSYQDGKGS
jgi:O-antigen ligase